MKFKLVDTNLFYLPGNPHMLHIASIRGGLREFIMMLDVNTQYIYIEECVLTSVDFQKDVWANLKFIEDDNLAYDLAKFCEENKVQDMGRITNYIMDGAVRKYAG
jgi:hypothetical protein